MSPGSPSNGTAGNLVFWSAERVDVGIDVEGDVESTEMTTRGTTSSDLGGEDNGKGQKPPSMYVVLFEGAYVGQ